MSKAGIILYCRAGSITLPFLSTPPKHTPNSVRPFSFLFLLQYVLVYLKPLPDADALRCRAVTFTRVTYWVSSSGNKPVNENAADYVRVAKHHSQQNSSRKRDQYIFSDTVKDKGNY